MSELSSGKRAALTVAFLLTGLCLCLLFLLVYTEGDWCRYCEYALVVLCALFAFRIRSLDAEGSITVAALFFTAVADFFLVALKDEQRLVGMAVFCCAQIFWCVRLLMLEKPNRRGGHLLALLLLVAALGIASLILCRGADALLLICSLYAALLLSTAVFSWFTLKNICFTLGMTFFVCCDFFVALNCAGGYLVLSDYPTLYKLHNLPLNMMWFFYGPSQMLLAISAAGSKKN